jgi:hypothetical protein
MPNRPDRDYLQVQGAYNLKGRFARSGPDNVQMRSVWSGLPTLIGFSAPEITLSARLSTSGPALLLKTTHLAFATPLAAAHYPPANTPADPFAVCWLVRIECLQVG